VREVCVPADGDVQIAELVMTPIVAYTVYTARQNASLVVAHQSHHTVFLHTITISSFEHCTSSRCYVRSCIVEVS
jgi:hypothetical protein